jgi:hypothetical protein
LPRANFLLALHGVADGTLQLQRQDAGGPSLWQERLNRGVEALQPLADLDHVLAGLGEERVRLLACALLRQLWHRLPDERSRTAVAVSERFARGLASAEELEAACQGAGHAHDSLDFDASAGKREAAWMACRAATLTRPADAIRARFVARDFAADRAALDLPELGAALRCLSPFVAPLSQIQGVLSRHLDR